MSKLDKLPYEEAAEHLANIKGWVCKTCQRYWGSDEHMARYCCCAGNRPCETSGCKNLTREKYYLYCESCRQQHICKRFLTLESRPYDGSPVVTYDDDKFFFDESELAEYLQDCYECHEEPMLVFAEPDHPKWDRSLSERFEDYIADGHEWDTSEVDAIIEKWVEENGPTVYWPGKVRVTAESLVEFLNKES